MKKILIAEERKEDIKDFYNTKKDIYNPVPVFSFLSEDDIDQGIVELIDVPKLEQEIQVIEEKSKGKKCIIAKTGFIICLAGWNEYPELTKMLTIAREWAFRNSGGGVGSNDYDEFDLKPEMMQLIIIDPNYSDIKGCIVGGYRYVIHSKETYKTGPMGDHFHFSEQWKSEQWIELGRSFVNPFLQKTSGRHSIDYVLHGLGYIFAQHPNSAGYFGKVTLYNIYEQVGAHAFFLATAKKYFHESNDVSVHKEERISEGELTEAQITTLNKDTFKGLFYILRNEYKINLVPIMAVYNRMVDLKKMYYFGGFRHDAFGNTTEVGIAIAYKDLYDVTKEKFVEPYI